MSIERPAENAGGLGLKAEQNYPAISIAPDDGVASVGYLFGCALVSRTTAGMPAAR
jgi:hypothetical protein